MAQPWRPEERLPRKRTGSSGSRVPPALTTRARPARSCGGRDPAAEPAASAIGTASPAAPRIARAAETMRPGSGSRPAPESPPVKGPASGGMTLTPRRRSVATFSSVAGLVHIRVCMAGARTTGAVVIRMVAVSRSSARPVARRASRSADAGATTTSSAHSPISTCSTAAGSSKTPVLTGRPVTAARAGAPMKRSAASVATVRTSCPSRRSNRMTEGAL